MNQYKVVMTGRLMTPALERIQETCEVKLWEKAESIPHETLVDWLKDAEGLVVTGDIQVNEELLQYAPKLKVIAQSAVGYDNVDTEACTRHGILFGNTPGVLVETTADLAFSLLLCAARRIHEGWNFVREGSWNRGSKISLGIDLAGKTLGIVGMGQIGVAVAKRAKVFGMNVIYYNRNRRLDDHETGATYQSFDAVLAQADCMIVLTPLSKETRGLFGASQFAQMKRTAYFVNMSRGPVVDTNALFDALQTGKIAYAALDVTDPEPLPGDHPLLTLSNILITPHIGSATQETRTAMSQLTADNLLAGLNDKPLPACVNAK
ncbi:2-hydroxyacid dehydrogenase [Pelosinus sp. sgz500959]|uniref:2-hydroxyacid dehydrogenase n=1 Tax=Pelosinus sp. sgz500959 TaxID=3242472 RepID=UPI00366B175A